MLFIVMYDEDINIVLLRPEISWLIAFKYCNNCILFYLIPCSLGMQDGIMGCGHNYSNDV